MLDDNRGAADPSIKENRSLDNYIALSLFFLLNVFGDGSTFPELRDVASQMPVADAYGLQVFGVAEEPNVEFWWEGLCGVDDVFNAAAGAVKTEIDALYIGAICHRIINIACFREVQKRISAV